MSRENLLKFPATPPGDSDLDNAGSDARIGLAFSGGGVRATVFHLGVLAKLARMNLMPNVRIISSVSGGSLAAGLVISSSGYRWPSSEEYLRETVPRILSMLTQFDLQWDYVKRSMLHPWRLLGGRANLLSESIESGWGIRGALFELPEDPKWIINATCYQTGKNWRFQRDLMGDYQSNYVPDPDFQIAAAMATSAAVPGLVGPLVVPTSRHQWAKFRDGRWEDTEPVYPKLHLWDGGVYDNLGVESLFKPSTGICEDADVLIVCDASRPLSADARQSQWRAGYLRASMRMVDIATDQVRSLRARMLMGHFKRNPGTGAFLRLGRPTARDYRAGSAAGRATLSDHEVRQVSRIETTLRRLSSVEFSMLFRHGYEVADTTLQRHGKQSLTGGRVNFRAA